MRAGVGAGAGAAAVAGGAVAAGVAAAAFGASARLLPPPLTLLLLGRFPRQALLSPAAAVGVLDASDVNAAVAAVAVSGNPVVSKAPNVVVASSAADTAYVVATKRGAERGPEEAEVFGAAAFAAAAAVEVGVAVGASPIAAGAQLAAVGSGLSVLAASAASVVNVASSAAALADPNAARPAALLDTAAARTATAVAAARACVGVAVAARSVPPSFEDAFPLTCTGWRLRYLPRYREPAETAAALVGAAAAAAAAAIGAPVADSADVVPFVVVSFALFGVLWEGRARLSSCLARKKVAEVLFGAALRQHAGVDDAYCTPSAALG